MINIIVVTFCHFKIFKLITAWNFLRYPDPANLIPLGVYREYDGRHDDALKA